MINKKILSVLHTFRIVALKRAISNSRSLFNTYKIIV